MWMDRFRNYTDWHDAVNRRHYDAPANPWELVLVDPSDVEYLRVVEIRWGLGRVTGGDWDRPENLRRIRGLPVYEGFVQHFEDGLDWADTVYADQARERIDENGQFRGCETIDEFLTTECPSFDDLYERIRRDGYRPNRGAIYERPAAVDSPHDLEPLVLIGRDGEVIWTEGFHRFVVADLLDVEAIPVYVVRRHEQWQRRRDEMARTPRSEWSSDLRASADHPDLADVRQ